MWVTDELCFERSAWAEEEVFYARGGVEPPMVAWNYRACITACLWSFLDKFNYVGGAQHATSPDPLAQPALDPHYYEDEFGQCLVGLPSTVDLTR